MKWLQLLLQAYLKYKQGRTMMPNNMGLLISLIVSIVIILVSVMFSVPIGYALILVWLCFAYALYRQGYNPKDLLHMSWTSAKTSIVVMQIFLLIGWLIAMWQAAGVIPMIIASGIELINPNLFIICAFLITSCVSMLLGTSLGTVGTIGIVLITIAKAGNLPIDIVAGAIMAGAYVGDRNSPLSSSASLVAALTHTKVNSNIPIMLKDSIPALIISSVLYLLLSFWFPLDYTTRYDSFRFQYPLDIMDTSSYRHWFITNKAFYTLANWYQCTGSSHPRNYPSKLYRNGYIAIYLSWFSST